MSNWNDRHKIFETEAKHYAQPIRVEDFNHSTYCSLKHKYFYGESPKTGCSTIKKVLIQAELERKVDFEDSEYIHFREFNPFLRIAQVGNLKAFFHRNDIFKFCFVRNPYTRLLSCYLDKIKNDKPQSHQIKTQLGLPIDSKKVITFEEFVDCVINQSVEEMDQHWRIQYYQTYQSNIKYDFIGRFENFEKDFFFVLNQLNISADEYYDIERSHATNALEKLKKYYTSEITDKVFKKYQIDFEYFGYEK